MIAYCQFPIADWGDRRGRKGALFDCGAVGGRRVPMSDWGGELEIPGSKTQIPSVSQGGRFDGSRYDTLRHNATVLGFALVCKLPIFPEFEKNILMSRFKLGLDFFGDVQIILLSRVATIF